LRPGCEVNKCGMALPLCRQRVLTEIMNEMDLRDVLALASTARKFADVARAVSVLRLNTADFAGPFPAQRAATNGVSVLEAQLRSAAVLCQRADRLIWDGWRFQEGDKRLCDEPHSTVCDVVALLEAGQHRWRHLCVPGAVIAALERPLLCVTTLYVGCGMSGPFERLITLFPALQSLTAHGQPSGDYVLSAVGALAPESWCSVRNIEIEMRRWPSHPDQGQAHTEDMTDIMLVYRLLLACPALERLAIRPIGFRGAWEAPESFRHHGLRTLRFGLGRPSFWRGSFGYDSGFRAFPLSLLCALPRLSALSVCRLATLDARHTGKLPQLKRLTLVVSRTPRQNMNAFMEAVATLVGASTRLTELRLRFWVRLGNPDLLLPALRALEGGTLVTCELQLTDSVSQSIVDILSERCPQLRQLGICSNEGALAFTGAAFPHLRTLQVLALGWGNARGESLMTDLRHLTTCRVLWSQAETTQLDAGFYSGRLAVRGAPRLRRLDVGLVEDRGARGLTSIRFGSGGVERLDADSAPELRQGVRTWRHAFELEPASALGLGMTHSRWAHHAAGTAFLCTACCRLELMRLERIDLTALEDTSFPALRSLDLFACPSDADFLRQLSNNGRAPQLTSLYLCPHYRQRFGPRFSHWRHTPLDSTELLPEEMYRSQFDVVSFSMTTVTHLLVEHANPPIVGFFPSVADLEMLSWEHLGEDCDADVLAIHKHDSGMYGYCGWYGSVGQMGYCVRSASMQEATAALAVARVTPLPALVSVTISRASRHQRPSEAGQGHEPQWLAPYTAFFRRCAPQATVRLRTLPARRVVNWEMPLSDFLPDAPRFDKRVFGWT
jgi:hypothetical protein